MLQIFSSVDQLFTLNAKARWQLTTIYLWKEHLLVSTEIKLTKSWLVSKVTDITQWVHPNRSVEVARRLIIIIKNGSVEILCPYINSNLVGQFSNTLVWRELCYWSIITVFLENNQQWFEKLRCKVGISAIINQ